MKINNLTPRCMFESLKIGDIFCSGSNHYIKISQVKEGVVSKNAVNLENGDLWSFSLGEIITKENAELMIC